MVLGSAEEAIESGVPAATMEKETLVVNVCGVVAESVTVTAMGKLPLAAGVPEIRPVFAARLSPAAKLPEVIDHV
jgi:hypothetical protein